MARAALLGAAALLLLLCPATRSTPPRLAPRPRDADDLHRLPTYARPSDYDIFLEPDIEAGTFRGTVTVTLTVNLDGFSSAEVPYEFLLQAEELAIDEVTVDGVTVEPDLVPEYDIVKISAGNELEHGREYSIRIAFNGKLRDDMVGFYKTTYFVDEEPRTVLSTQFQPTHARKAFPCLDEPQFKARFTLHMLTPDGFHTIGNMKLDDTSSDESGRGTWYHFQTSPHMSTYLVAFVVSDFEKETDGGSALPEISTWARGNAIDWGKYSLEITRDLVETLEEYTGIKYVDPDLDLAFDKIDQVAVPDFSAGAMENWGLITYRETALLYHDGPATAKRRVVLVIAHELVHMWFGNLVTTDWWSATWLNEAFAEYFEYVAVDSVEPTWHTKHQILIQEVQNALARDAVSAAKPLTHDVVTPQDALDSFHALTYVKGASIVRMLNAILGEDNFQDALSKYLKEHSYKTVVPSDLFEALAPYAEHSGGLSGEQLTEMLELWTTQHGYPLVRVERNYEENTAEVSQTRYFVNPDEEESDLLWYVPLTWRGQGEDFEVRMPQKYLEKERSTTIGDLPDEKSWVIFNVQETGYYRVNYDERNWALIAGYLRNGDNALGGVHVLNRAQLLDDVFSLARSEHVPYTTAFALADYLPRETEYVPWAAALGAFAYLERMLVAHEKYPLFQSYVRNLVAKQYERFNFEDRDLGHLDKLLLNEVATWACRLGHAHCTASAAAELQKALDGDGDGSITADLRSVVYCYGVRHSPDEYWDKLWERYQRSRDDAERALMATGLGCSNDPDKLETYLGYSIDPLYIRRQDASSVFTAVYANPLGVTVALDFLAKHFEDIDGYYSSMSAMYNIITGIAGRITTQEQEDSLTALLNEHADKLSEGTAQTARDTARSNIVWVDRYQEKIVEALEPRVLYRLPTAVLPVQYTLQLAPRVAEDTFDGSVSILVSAEEATSVILLHAQQLTVDDNIIIRLYDDEDASANSPEALPHVRKARGLRAATGDNLFESLEQRADYELLWINLKEPLVAGRKYLIEIEYSGPLRDDMVGFYKTYYTNDRGDHHYLFGTKFAPTHARKAFPCFDEPSLKARFQINIVTPPIYHSISSMPIERITRREDGSSEYVFENSLKMSTYIVAWLVSDLVAVHDTDGEVKFSTWTRLNARRYSDYSIQKSRSFLQFLEEYTGYNYYDPEDDHPLRKVDQVGTPDFVSGAMENWGLITYRETALLYNGGTQNALQRVAMVIAHELAHMWFGNLVTTKWWESTWLNEGFATYFQYYATHPVEPRWGLLNQFVIDQLQPALALDQVSGIRALTQEVVTPADAVASFGSITYNKGASILRMISYTLGADKMKSAIQSYVNKHAYGATTPEDLFDELLEYATDDLPREDLLRFLISWTEQPGFPLVTVERTQSGNNVNLKVTQERFTLYNEDLPKKLYYIPLSWRVAPQPFDYPEPQRYISDKEETIEIELTNVESDKWIVFNVQHLGFFRVNYDAVGWQLIIDQLRTPRPDDIHWLNRAQLLDDAFTLARAGRLDYETAFRVSDYLSSEIDYVAWAAGFNSLTYINRMLQGREEHELFKRYAMNLLGQNYRRTWSEGYDQEEILWINGLTTWACAMSDETCVVTAAERLLRYLDTDVKPSADLRSVVYCYGSSIYSLWFRLLDRLQDSLDEAERALLINGLACHPLGQMKYAYLNEAVLDNGVRKQERSSVFAAVYGQPGGVDVVLDFLQDKFAAAQDALGSLTSILTAVGGRINTSGQRDRLAAIIQDNGVGSAGDAALLAADRNLQWIERNFESVVAALNARVGFLSPVDPVAQHEGVRQ